MKRCSACSTLVDDNASFCSNCGSNQFIAENTVASQYSEGQQGYYTQPNQQQFYYQQPQNNMQNQQFAQMQNNTQYPQFNQQYQQPYQNVGQPDFVNNQMPIPQSVNFKDFVEKFASEKHKKNIKSVITFYYVGCVLTALVAIGSAAQNGTLPLGLVDAIVFCVLTLGLQKTKKRVFVISILILSVVGFISGIAISGTPTGLLWIINSIFLLKTYKELNSEYQQFKNSF